MTNIKEHDIVKLDSGELGTIVHIYPDKVTCEVETENKVTKKKISELTKI